jgi:hypothetical protein
MGGGSSAAFDGIVAGPDGGGDRWRRARTSSVRSARWNGFPTLARTSFSAPEAHIVVSTDGYFDVYPTSTRTNGDKPAYRGRLVELGAGIRGADDRLAVRPSSPALAEAVMAWAAVHGAAALGGSLGAGRDGNEEAA